MPVNLSSQKSKHQVAAARCRWGTAKPPGFPVLSARQNGARDKEGVIKALIMELCPFSSWLSQAELCSPSPAVLNPWQTAAVHHTEESPSASSCREAGLRAQALLAPGFRLTNQPSVGCLAKGTSAWR